MVGSAGDAGLEPSPPKAPTPRETELGLWPSYGLPPGRLNASDVDRRALAAAAAARPLDFVRPWTKREGPEIGVGAVEWAEDGVEVEEEEKSEVSHDIGGCEGGVFDGAGEWAMQGDVVVEAESEGREGAGGETTRGTRALVGG